MKESLKQSLSNLRTFLGRHSQMLIVTGIGVALTCMIAALFVYNNPSEPAPNIVTQPVDACQRFTADEARGLLGETVISLNTAKPVLTDNITTSTCSYTDTDRDQNKMRVAAVIVRTGINELGDKKIRDDFAASKPTQGVVEVPDLGTSAYFDPSNGQLKVLDTHLSIIISYGIGATPSLNTLEDATALARLLYEKDTPKT